MSGLGTSPSQARSPGREQLLLIELDEHDLHFVDTIIMGYDGLAHLRRDYRLIEGRTFFELIVPEGFLEEVKQLLEELRVRGFARLGEVRQVEAKPAREGPVGEPSGPDG